VRLAGVRRQRRAAELVVVRLGTFDEDPGVRPSMRIFTSSAATWEPIPDDGLKRFPEGLTA
jgi:hypothetical protein